MTETISVTKAAKILGYVRQHITLLIRQGKLPAYRRPNAKKTSGYKIKIEDVYRYKQLCNAPKTEKRCASCYQIKPLSEFNRHKQNKDGYKSYCRQCQRNLYKRDREHILEQKKEYGRQNKAKIKQRRDKRYKELRQEILTRDREKYIFEKDKINEHRRFLYATNEQVQNKAKSHSARRRASKYPHIGKAELILRTEIITRDGRYCWMCGDGPLADNEIHLDHVIPLSRGGLHDATNLLVSCATCNLRKRDKLPEEIHELICKDQW